MNHWIGTSGFQYPEWKGTFYPEDLPTSKMLPFYAEHFSTTEVNYSFRRIPSPKTIQNWCYRYHIGCKVGDTWIVDGSKLLKLLAQHASVDRSDKQNSSK